MKWQDGIYRAGKQRMLGPRGVHLYTIHQRSKGCIVHLGTIQRSIQKVAYVQYFEVYLHVLFIEYNILFVNIRPGVPSCIFALKGKSVCPVQKSNFPKIPF
jgi:hypothetical protein